VKAYFNIEEPQEAIWAKTTPTLQSEAQPCGVSVYLSLLGCS